MAVRLRFRRIGKPKSAFYQLVAIDRRKSCEAACIEVLGQYNPRAPKTEKLVANLERLGYWLKNGAQTSDSVQSLLKSSGLWARLQEAKSK